MSTFISSSPPAVPSIHIQGADDSPVLFEGDSSFLYPFEDPGLYTCSQPLQSDYLPPNTISPSAELEEISELSHLSSMNQFLTGHGYSQPYSTIIHEGGATTSADHSGLSPTYFGSPIPSPASSFSSSLSPSSLHDSTMLSENDSSFSASPVIPDQQYPWAFNHPSSDSLLQPFMGSFSNDPLPPSSLGPQTGAQRPRSASSPTRPGPVASKAMLEANSRRRRHPPQFVCPECGQTFTAQFSLKRHAQSHTGERPFACAIPGCTQRFFNSSDCKRHEKSRKRHKDLVTP